MSDIKLFNIKSKKLGTANILNKIQVQKIIEENCYDLLGLKQIASNISITQNPHEILETLAIDEDYCLVVVEYRIGKFIQSINKGLVFIDYINNNKSKIKVLLNELIGIEEANKVIIQPRLIIIGNDFNQYDEYAIKQVNVEIDLIRYLLVDKNNLIIEKNYQSRKMIEGMFKNRLNTEELNLLKLINEYVLSLGDEVVEKDYNDFIIYRKIKDFMYIIYNDGIELKLKMNGKFKTIKIRNSKDFDKYAILIEQSYDLG